MPTTAVELNAALVAEFRRIGSREAIVKVMSDFGVVSVNELEIEQYPLLLAEVRAIPS
jgi:hypothetical protein